MSSAITDSPPSALRRVGRLLLRLALSLLALLTLCLALLVLFFPTQRVRPWVEAELAERLGVPVAVDDLEISLFHGLGLEASGVRVGPTGEAAEPWLVLERLLFRFDLSRLLLHKELEIHALRVSGLDVLLEQNQGQWNWPFLNGAAKTKKTPPPNPPKTSGAVGGPRLAIDELLIERARLRVRTPGLSLETGPYNLRAQGALAPGETLTARLWLAEGAEPTELRLALGPSGRGPRLSTRLSGALALRVAGADEVEAHASLGAKGLVLLGSGGRAVRLGQGATARIALGGSLAERRFELSELSLEAGGLFGASASGSLALGEGGAPPTARLKIARAELALDELSRYGGALVDEAPSLGGRLSVANLSVQLTGGSEPTLRLGGEAKLSGGSLELARGAGEAQGLALRLKAEGVALRGDHLEGGKVSGHLTWALLGHPQVGELGRGSLEVSGDLSGGALDWRLRARSRAALSLGGLSYSGPLSLGAEGALDPATAHLALSNFEAKAEGVSASLQGEVGWKGKPALSLAGEARIDTGPFAAAWLRAGGSPSMFEQSALAGPLHLRLSAAGWWGQRLKLDASVSGQVATARGGPLLLDRATLEGRAHMVLDGRRLQALSGQIQAEGRSVGYAGRGAQGLSLAVRFSRPRARELVAHVEGRLGRIWLSASEKERPSPGEVPPLGFTGKASVGLGRNPAGEFDLTFHWGAALAARLWGRSRPRERYLEFSARSLGPWSLESLVSRLPRSLRAPLREGRAQGRLSWELSARGQIPRRFDPEMDLPFDLRARADWEGVSFALLHPDFSVEAMRGRIELAPRPGGGGLEASGTLEVPRSQWTELREEPLGPTVASFRAHSERLSEFSIEELLLYSDAFKTSLRASATARPLARPPTLQVRAESVTGTPARWRLRPRTSLAGTIRTNLLAQRQGRGPLVVRGELLLNQVGLWQGQGLAAEQITGRIPIATALSFSGPALLGPPPAAPRASEPGALPGLLFEELARLAPPEGEREEGLRLARLRAGRLTLEEVNTNARLRGADLELGRLGARFLGGTLSGQGRIRLGRPLEATLSLSARDLDARGLIPPERLGHGAGGSKAYRVNADLNLKARYPPPEIEGEVQVTRLGREVLFAILDGVDPQGANLSVTNLRRQLNENLFISPKVLEIRARHGMADTYVGLQALYSSPLDRRFLSFLIYRWVLMQPMDYPLPAIPLKNLLEVVTK